MRGFGRVCAGKRKVYLRLVRDTERRLLQVGQGVRVLAISAHLLLHDISCAEGHQERLEHQLSQAVEHHKLIAHQSRCLIHGKKLPQAKIVNAYDPGIVPIEKGKSNRPSQFGRKPGVIAEVATGFIFGLHLPQGNPADQSYLMPLLGQVQQAIDQLPYRRKPAIHSVAADLSFRGEDLHKELNRLGILTVGMPQTSDPVPSLPPPEMVEAQQQQETFPSPPSARQVEIAYACGYRRPLVESLIESLACRGATQIKYKGHRGAILQTTMAILAGNGATIMRIQGNRLSKKARKFRRFFGLTPPNPLKNNTRFS